MADRRSLVLTAARKALEIRQQHQVDKTQPVNPIELAGCLGIQVWLRDAKTYDGAYSAGGPPIIVVSSLRPAGRMSFTCAHEIGHHVFQHGSQVEEVLQTSSSGPPSDEELLAHAFAANLLMPRSAVVHGWSVRSLDNAIVTPVDILRLSSWLGVGYATLLTHMSYELRLLKIADLRRLQKGQPAAIKAAISGADGGAQDVLVVDEMWSGRTIDCRINDFVCLPRNTVVAGEHLVQVGETTHGWVFKASRVGKTTCTNSGWNAGIRIARRGKMGRAIYIYDDEEEDD